MKKLILISALAAFISSPAFACKEHEDAMQQLEAKLEAIKTAGSDQTAPAQPDTPAPQTSTQSATVTR